MDHQAEIARLRRDGELRALPGGDEGVPISVQFHGELPALSRAERKAWLEHHFSEVASAAADSELALIDGSLSVSAQSIEALCAASRFEEIKGRLEAAGHRVGVVRKIMAAMPAKKHPAKDGRPAS